MSKTAGVEVISHFTGPVFHRFLLKSSDNDECSGVTVS